VASRTTARHTACFRQEKSACGLKKLILLSPQNMRITVEIDASELKKIQKATGQQKKSPAVTQALSDFLKMQARQKLIDRALSGSTDFSLTNDELEKRDVYEAR
jgi:Arc/MetJ family transcription regulator